MNEIHETEQSVSLLEDEALDEVNERLSLIRKRDGLTFTTDAYLLAAFSRPCKRGRAVELGTGTGIVSLLCAARERYSSVVAVEIQEDFADLAQRNVILNRLDERMRVLCADVRTLCAADVDGEVEAVLANPPYMRTDSGKRNESDHKYIARHEVCGTVADFCAAAGRILKYGGRFYCVYRPDRLSDLMAALRENRLEPKTMVFVHADEESEPSSVLVCAVKGGGVSTRILPPLFLHSVADRGQRSRVLSRRAARIYETMSFEEMEKNGKEER